METIRFHLRFGYGEAVKRANELLEEVGIAPERASAFPHEFSGGMRQRIVIALALAAEPKLIIADEPTTALDVSIQAQILKLLRRLCQERSASVILITHDMGVIAETTDRVAVLYAGRMVEIGATSAVIKDPRHPYTKGLMAATLILIMYLLTLFCLKSQAICQALIIYLKDAGFIHAVKTQCRVAKLKRLYSVTVWLVIFSAKLL